MMHGNPDAHKRVGRGIHRIALRGNPQSDPAKAPESVGA